MTQFMDTLVGIFQSSGFARFGEPGGYLYAIMICVGCFLLYLAIVKEFEPLILLPMAFGMILANLPGSGVIHMQYFVGDGLEHPMWVEILNNGGLADMLYMGVKLGIYPPLIFLGIGTMTDFAPLISNPKSLLLPRLPQSPLPRCSRPLLRLPRWRKAFPVMWWLPSWPPSTQWAMASTPSRRCAAAPTAGARPV